jgi:hypothetical protein
MRNTPKSRGGDRLFWKGSKELLSLATIDKSRALSKGVETQNFKLEGVN